MTLFKENKNSFASMVQTIKGDLHSFASLGIGKGDNASHLRKKALLRKITTAITEVDTNQCGIRVVLVKTKN